MRNFTFAVLAALTLAGCRDDDKDKETSECVSDTADTSTADTSVTPVGCTDSTGDHASGESWTCPDGCNTCSCDNGTVTQTEMACADTGDTAVPPDTGDTSAPIDTGSDTGESDTGGSDTSSG